MSSLYRVNYQLRSHKRDPLIEFIKAVLLTPFVLHATPGDPAQHDDSADINRASFAEIMSNVEDLITEHMHMENKGLREHSRLYRLVPSVGRFFTPLPLKQVFLDTDHHMNLSARRFVPPSFNEIRNLLNMAQIRAISSQLQLITFDGDMTLYADGKDFEHDSVLVDHLIALLEHDLHVAVVTAAGYGSDAIRYESRLSGLLAGFKRHNLSKERCGRFFVLGGECNFLFQCNEEARLCYMEPSQYASLDVLNWEENVMKKLLDTAEYSLKRCVKEMKLPASVYRKSRAVGLVPDGTRTLPREQLDECVLATQQRILKQQRQDGAVLPFCAFNGGSDVWVDIGNKLIGVQVLQHYLGASPSTTLHVGDQFLSTGNDFATRSACCTLWIVSPQETSEALSELTSRFL